MGEWLLTYSDCGLLSESGGHKGRDEESGVHLDVRRIRIYV